MSDSLVCPNIDRRVGEQCSARWKKIYREIGQTQRQKDHSACTTATCFANDLQTSNILPRHTSPECSCHLLGADPHHLQKTLKSHGVALIRLDERDERIEISVEPMVRDINYFAISHALADGLCNTARNELPQCQLRRILRSVKSAMFIQRLPQDYPVYVWIDIMCLPLRSSPFDGVTASTFQALQYVMKNAVAVVVLDTDIAVLGRDSSFAKRFLKISYSSWGSRLWTLFEAMIAPKLLFECRDGVMELGGFLGSPLDVATIEDVSNWHPLLHARLGKPTKHHRDVQVLLELALNWGRTSVESDSTLLKTETEALFENASMDSQTSDIQHRL